MSGSEVKDALRQHRPEYRLAPTVVPPVVALAKRNPVAGIEDQSAETVPTKLLLGDHVVDL